MNKADLEDYLATYGAEGYGRLRRHLVRFTG